MKDQFAKTGVGVVCPKARNHNLIVQALPDEELVYDMKSQRAHCLNQSAAAIWRQCDGQHTAAEIAIQIQPEIGAIASVAFVKLGLEQLSKANLLEQPFTLDGENTRQTRREVLRQMGAGAAAAVPLVLSVIAPLSVQAMTCVGSGTPGNSNGCPCAANTFCTSGCCGFSAGVGNLCVSVGSVGSGGPCRSGCECVSGSCVNPPGPGGLQCA